MVWRLYYYLLSRPAPIRETNPKILVVMLIPHSGPYPLAVDHDNHLQSAKRVRKLIGYSDSFGHATNVEASLPRQVGTVPNLCLQSSGSAKD